LHELPANREVKVELRFGVLAFHTLGPTASRGHSLRQILLLAPHRDFKMQFSPQLKFDLEQLQDVFVRSGFELMEAGRCTLVKLVEQQSGSGYSVVFVEPTSDDTGDPRTDPRKMQELERMAKCRSSAEVLEVPSGATGAVVKKAYNKKSLLVHPDKNAFVGATEAMKVLTNARDALDNDRSQTLTPPLFKVGSAAKELPQIVQFRTRKTTHLQDDIAKTDGILGYRCSVTSSGEETDNAKARAFLERAWKQGGIVEGRELSADTNYSIDSVRVKEWMLFSNGNFSLSLETVAQKTLDGAGRFQTFPEISVAATDLSEKLRILQSGPDDCQKAACLKLYEELVTCADALSVKLARLHARQC